MFSIRTAMVVVGCLTFAGCATVGTQDEGPAIQEEARLTIAEKDVSDLARLAQEHAKAYQESKDVQDLDQALDALHAARRLEPDNPGVNVMLYGVLADKALATLNEDLLDELRAPYDVAFQMAPTLVRELPPPGFVTADVYWRISARDGLSSEQEKAYEDKAIKALRETVRDRPAFARAHVMLADAYYRRDLNDLALFEAQEAVRLAPESAYAHYLLGRIHRENVHRDDACYDRASVDAAVRAYKEAIRLAPDWADAHRRLSDALVHQGQYELAVFEAQQAIELQDSALNHAALAYTLNSAGRPEESVKASREALKRSPQYASAQRRLALALFLARRYEAAVEAYKRYLELSDSPWIYSVLHQHFGLMHLGRDEEARRLLERYADRVEEPWDENVVAYYLGKLSPEQLQKRVENDCQRQLTGFYAAYDQLLKGRTEEAQQGLKVYLSANLYCYRSTHIARARLAQLGEPTR